MLALRYFTSDWVISLTLPPITWPECRMILSCEMALKEKKRMAKLMKVFMACEFCYLKVCTYQANVKPGTVKR